MNLPTHVSTKMVLGTAQFGMNYGITNSDGKPSKKEAFNVLDFSWGRGIKSFDTAPGYNSEALLGDFIESNGLNNKVKVHTKIPPLKGVRDYQKFILKNLENSLSSLRCPVGTLFFHDPKDADFLLKDQQFFEDLMKNYAVSTLGVSVYSPSEVENFSDCEFNLAFQFPYNFLDRRFDDVSIDNGLAFARSIFLQGILVSNKNLIKNSPQTLKEIHKKIHNIFEENKVNPLEYAFNFAVNSSKIDFFIFGVHNLKQLIQIFSLSNREYSFHNELRDLLTLHEKSFLDPRKWS
ncbi:aldo/keto reductase [Candidatus Thioglobus sp.]|nr:aldo/keto reductase [Candidatus Thioglobus sp.]